jgi:hypothetical protein
VTGRSDGDVRPHGHHRRDQPDRRGSATRERLSALHWIIFLAAVGIGIALAAKRLWPLIWWPILTALSFVPAAEAAFSRGMWTVFNVIEVVIAVIMVIVGARSTAGDLD